VNIRIHTYISTQTFQATLLRLILLISDYKEFSIAPLVGSMVLETPFADAPKALLMILL